MLDNLVLSLNKISTPILAIWVIVLGCTFAVISKLYGLDGNTAAGIVGAGIGLLTGQALGKKVDSEPIVPTTVVPQVPQGR